MVKFGRAFIAIVLVLSIFLASCAQEQLPQQEPEVSVPDPFEELVEQFQLTEDQAEQLCSGNGTLQLTATQVELLRPIVEEVLEDPEYEEWLGEARWTEMQDIYGGILADGRVELQRVADLANDIYEHLQHDEAVEVVTSLVKLSHEEAELAQSLGTWSTTSESSTLVYTPRGVDLGDRDFDHQPAQWGWTRAWAKYDTGANAESGGVAVYAEARIGAGSAEARARQRILIHVANDDTDMEIRATILYETATSEYFMDAGGTHTTYRDITDDSWVHESIIPMIGWTEAVKKVTGTFEKIVSVLGLAVAGMEIDSVAQLMDDFNDYDALHEILQEAKWPTGGAREVVHTAYSLDSGYYRFEVGIRARTVSVFLGTAAAIAVGQVTQIEVTQSVQEEPVTPEYSSRVTAGGLHTVGLKSDGTVLAVGWNDAGQLDVEYWTGIVQVAAGYIHTVGLRANGTVVAEGSNDSGQCNVGDWANIVQVSAGWYHTVGLKFDGTVVAVGRNAYGQCNVGDWTDIVQVATGWGHTVGLKSDGTVVAVGRNTNGQCNVGDWTDILGVSAGRYHTVGLRADTRAIAVGNNGNSQCDVWGWMNLIQMVAGQVHSIGVRHDGTVVAVGWNGHGQCDVGDWTDIVEVAGGNAHTVGLKADGTVVAVGSNGSGQCDVGDWNLGAISP